MKQIKKFFRKNLSEKNKKNIHQDLINHGFQTYLFDNNKAVWSPRSYENFATEAYSKNVIAFRAINMIASSCSSVDWQVKKQGEILNESYLLNILNCPSPNISGKELIENFISHLLISGNAYLLKIHDNQGNLAELHNLKPSNIKIICNKNGNIDGYLYKINNKEFFYKYDNISGQSDILHLKYFNPLNDYYGMSPIEAASFAIDQHNQAAIWNQSLLQNSAKPSGALVFKTKDGSGGYLSDEQYDRLKTQVNEQFSGASNAGKPMLLECGLDWKEMSFSPKDMDYLEAKHTSAREIALAFGMSPQLLAIPGDNTYSNLSEARLAFWEQTILPLLDKMQNKLNNWLLGKNSSLKLIYDKNNIPALALKRDKYWQKINDARFLSDDEKKRILGV